jgi:GT2 family glycosyltransferase
MDHFHRDRQAGLHDSAEAHLERALHTPEYRSEALIWKGIEALQHNKPQSAFVYLSNAAHALPRRTDVQALAGRSIQLQHQPELAQRYLKAAWRDAPLDPALRLALWQSRSQTEQPARLRRLILAQLPDIDDPRELKLVLGLLAAQADAPASVGVVRHDAAQGEVTGWAINLRSSQAVPQLTVLSNGTEQIVQADTPCQLLTSAGLPATHGAIHFQIGSAPQTLQLHFANGLPLQGSPLSILPAFEPPPPVEGNNAALQPVDVLVPVYEGLNETLECLNSVLRHRHVNRTEHRLVVLDDATPNVELRTALEALADSGQIHYLRQPGNLGFIRNTNRGMALSPERDVVWLNADTRVHGNWLDRLRAVAYEAQDIASVTPFTNNGELMSFPVSRLSHDMPSAEQQAELDRLAAQAANDAVEIETGCGFCLYIKRSALDAVGYLDEVHLLRGYGEETDWCLRARSLGWRHMGAPQVFVAHQGGISFGDEKALRVAHNNAILRRRYPDAEARYKTFCLRDPLGAARQRLQRARLEQLRTWLTDAQGQAELVIHAGSASQAPLTLSYQHQAQGCVVTLKALLMPLPVTLDYVLPGDGMQLLADLQSLPLDELIYQQLAGCPANLCELPTQLKKPYRIICRDDELLQQGSASDWPSFARRARSAQLPWKALHKRYAAALPGTKITVANKRKVVAASKSAPRILLIADKLHNIKIAEQWLHLGRRITRQKLPIMLLTHNNGPWLRSLLATGAIQALPDVPGLNLADRILLAGCNGALSLELNPGANWGAPDLAIELGLPLYAMPSAVANESGTLSINQLPISPSRA